MTPTFAGLGCAMLRHAVTIRHKVTRVHRPFTSILVWILQSLASFVTAPGPNPASHVAAVHTWPRGEIVMPGLYPCEVGRVIGWEELLQPALV